MDDEVLYKLPLWPFGEVAYPFVKRKVEGIFLLPPHEDPRDPRLLGLLGLETGPGLGLGLSKVTSLANYS